MASCLKSLFPPHYKLHVQLGSFTWALKSPVTAHPTSLAGRFARNIRFPARNFVTFHRPVAPVYHSPSHWSVSSAETVFTPIHILDKQKLVRHNGIYIYHEPHIKKCSFFSQFVYVCVCVGGDLKTHTHTHTHTHIYIYIYIYIYSFNSHNKWLSNTISN